ncbi:MAG: hypothetical protein BMS9Abin37_1526 [Acidobacteriota bacterium]|nr:MAG: hypothetical protein BMS9Abin37_1526 [Acidobacteriota bacterium]
MPKRRESVAEHPFRKTTSGFESPIPRGGSEDFFFSQLLADPDHAAEFFERGDDQDPLLGDPRVGIAVSAFAHIVLVLFFFLDPSLGGLNAQTDQEIAEIDKKEPLVLFMDEPQAPPVAVVPAVPVVPVPQAQPTPPEAQANENPLLIPKAMLEPERRAEIMDDLPFSTGNTEEFYTDEEVKDPGEEGDAEEVDEVETEPLVAEESGEDDVDSDEAEGTDDGNDAVEVADSLDTEDLGDLLFRDSLLEPTEEARTEEAQRRRIQPPEPRVTRGDVGQGGENGRFTDIRRFLAGARFDHPEGGLVMAGRDNTLYYNDRGADFVPWIRRMLAEVRRTWIASMPYAANVYAGHTAVGFTVARNGTVIVLETIMRSGVPGFDNNAEGAIRGARLLPLPPDYPDETFDIVIVFWVNERPYDIFG